MAAALTGSAIVAGLLRFNFSTYGYNEYLVGNMLGLFWVPMLMVLIVFREEPGKFGMALGSARRIWAIAGILFAGLVALMFLASRWQAFQDYYPVFRRYWEFTGAFRGYPETNPYTSFPWLMLFAEASYGMYLFCWEFFFRGYLLFGLSRSLKSWVAVLLQAIAFGILHWGKPSTEIAASFGAGIILGIIALNAKSFIPCFVLHWAASMSFDFLVVARR